MRPNSSKATPERPIRHIGALPSPPHSPAAAASVKPARSSSQSSAFNPVMPVVEALREGSWKKADEALLRNEIVPRVLLCSTNDLIEDVFDIPRTHFELMWHQSRFRKGKAKKAPTASWIEGVAQHVGQKLQSTSRCHAHDKRPHEFRLSAAVAQRPYRIGVHDELNDYDEYTDVKDLPLTTTPFLTCARDASTSPSGETFWNRVMVTLAVGLSPRPATPYDAGDEVHAPELVRVVFDLVEHVLAQPSRLFAPGLAINENVAYLVVLDHETCRIATISDCWQTGFGELAAVLSVLLDLDVYLAGFPSFLRYKCLPSSGITAVSLLTSVFDSSAGRTVQFKEEGGFQTSEIYIYIKECTNK